MDAVADAKDGATEKTATCRAVENVYARFGGIREAALVVDRNVSRLYRWKEEGVPRKAMEKLLAAAQERSLDVEAGDFFSPDRLDVLLGQESRSGAQDVG